MISLLFALCAIQSTALVFMFLRQRAFERKTIAFAESIGAGAHDIRSGFRKMALGGALLLILSILNRKNTP